MTIIVAGTGPTHPPNPRPINPPPPNPRMTAPMPDPPPPQPGPPRPGTQTGAAVEASPAANGARRANGSAPAGGPSVAATRSGLPVPLVSVSQPFGVAGGRWGFDSRRGAA